MPALRRRPGRQAGTDLPARRSEIITAAGKLFSRNGFDAASMRDIARDVGLTVGALYWHFKSKEEIFSAVHASGIKGIHDAVVRAIDGISDPWDRLQAAAEEHCESLLNPDDVMAVLIPASLGPVRRKLLAQREEYEKFVTGLVQDVAIPSGVDRSVFRLQLLVALNGIATWYRPDGRYSPREIARQYIQMLRPAGAGRRSADGSNSARQRARRSAGRAESTARDE